MPLRSFGQGRCALVHGPPRRLPAQPQPHGLQQQRAPPKSSDVAGPGAAAQREQAAQHRVDLRLSDRR
eukprot:7949435-Lingulodinium_polyedra.AAC.1